jgi:hypothetical protein
MENTTAAESLRAFSSQLCQEPSDSLMFRHLLLFLCLASPAAYSLPIPLIDFEGILDSTFVTNEYAGVLFTNAFAVTAGISLNEIDFPPHSDVNAAMDFGGPMVLALDQLANSFSAYFTYNVTLELTFYDSSNVLLATVFSSGANNIGANEYLEYTNLSGFSSIRILGDPGGGSFVVDDIQLAETAVPEPGMFGVVLMGILVAYRRKA